MSNAVLSWVWSNSSANGSNRLLLLALADEARDDGYVSGKEYGSMSHLERKCRFASRETTVAARKWLEVNGELLVQTPADRGWGRHNDYLVVMGRDATELARSRGWTSHQRSIRQTDPSVDAVPSSSASAPVRNAIPRTDEENSAHRGAQAVPPAAPVEQATEPVDIGVPAPQRSVYLADRTNRATGPGPVQDRFDLTDAPLTPHSPQEHIDLVALAHERHHECARPAVRDEDDLVDVLDDVRRHLASLVPGTDGVRWDLTNRQMRELLVHSVSWPSRDGVTVAWSTAAAASVAEHEPPRSARAWVALWLMTDPPDVLPGESMCEEHTLGELLVPTRICAMCRVAVLAS